MPDAPINLLNVPSVTNANQIGLEWSEGASNGGTAIIDYLIQYAEVSAEFETLEVAVTTKSYTATSLTAGLTYKFKVQARNSFGYSAFSTQVEILAAQVPDKPDAPVTTFNGDTVTVDWTEPFTGGFEITAYRIYFAQSDTTTYSYELNGCDGTDPTIRDARTCTVLVSVLRDAPFNLEWGTSIYSKVDAINAYGISELSDAGNGAVIITYPDAPVDLTEVIAERTSTSITLSWS